MSNNISPKRITKYIDKIGLIPEGKRNRALYSLGVRLRTKFGLRLDSLEQVLSEVNQTKCTEPLPESEIAQIARSVDNSKVPIGEPSASYVEQQDKMASVPKSRIVYTMSTSDTSVAVADLLQKEVSLYPHCKANTPSGTATIAKVLEAFRVGGKFTPQIEAVRNETDKEKRSELKKTTLPGVVFGSEPQEKRNNAACKPNGIICLDFDGIPAEKLESAKQTIMAMLYVFAVGLSASGNGFFALAAYGGTLNLKDLLQAMQADFQYEIDKARSDVCGLRYVTLHTTLT